AHPLSYNEPPPDMKLHPESNCRNSIALDSKSQYESGDFMGLRHENRRCLEKEARIISERGSAATFNFGHAAPLKEGRGGASVIGPPPLIFLGCSGPRAGVRVA